MWCGSFGGHDLRAEILSTLNEVILRRKRKMLLLLQDFFFACIMINTSEKASQKSTGKPTLEHNDVIYTVSATCAPSITSSFHPLVNTVFP